MSFGNQSVCDEIFEENAGKGVVPVGGNKGCCVDVALVGEHTNIAQKQSEIAFVVCNQGCGDMLLKLEGLIHNICQAKPLQCGSKIACLAVFCTQARGEILELLIQLPVNIRKQSAGAQDRFRAGLIQIYIRQIVVIQNLQRLSGFKVIVFAW